MENMIDQTGNNESHSSSDHAIPTLPAPCSSVERYVYPLLMNNTDQWKNSDRGGVIKRVVYGKKN